MNGSCPSWTNSSRRAALSPMRGLSVKLRSRWRSTVKYPNRHGCSSSLRRNDTAVSRRLQCPAQAHAWRPTHDFATLDGPDHGLSEMIEGGILGKVPLEHGAEQERTGALERLFVDRDRDLDPPRGPDATALPDTARDRPAVDVADAANAPLGDRILHVREHRKGLTQRLGIVTAPALDDPHMVGAEHVDEAPRDGAGVRRLAAAAQLGHDRLAWRRGAGDAHQVERGIIDQPKIRAPRADRQMFRQMPVGAQGPGAQFGDRVGIVCPP